MAWRESKPPNAYGAIVSDEPTGHDDPENVIAYGGHLVAESVPKKLMPLIIEAPELLMLVNSFVVNRKQLSDEHFSGVADRLFNYAAEVVARAKGEST